MANTSMGAARRPSTKSKNTKGEPGNSQVKHLLSMNGREGKPSFTKAYSFGIVTAGLFLLSWTGQFFTQLVVVRNESAEHGQPFEWADFMAQFFASTFENWQSEFLQLVWQAAGLTLLLFWGSSQSKESDERIEVKIDRLLLEQGIDPSSISAEVNRSV
jgi:hypothetical protein